MRSFQTLPQGSVLAHRVKTFTFNQSEIGFVEKGKFSTLHQSYITHNIFRKNVLTRSWLKDLDLYLDYIVGPCIIF